MATATVPDLGEQAPDFVLRDSTGTERSLGELVRDRPQVLIFYRGHW
jgi:peroxiredoxin